MRCLLLGLLLPAPVLLGLIAMNVIELDVGGRSDLARRTSGVDAREPGGALVDRPWVDVDVRPFRVRFEKRHVTIPLPVVDVDREWSRDLGAIAGTPPTK